MRNRIDCAEIVKDAVTMQDVLTSYGLPTSGHGRIPCPIHGGVKNNFAYKRDYYKCYVCGATGDVISFVMQYRGLSFMDALRELDGLFHLNLPIDDRRELDETAMIEAARRLQERQEAERQRDALYSALCDAIDRYTALDMILIYDAPDGPYTPPSDEYIYAAKHIDAAWYAVEEAEDRIYEFRQKQKERDERRREHRTNDTGLHKGRFSQNGQAVCISRSIQR